MRVSGVIEFGMLAVVILGILGGIWNRIKLKKGIGLRFIQYLGLVVILPVIVILSLEHRLSKDATGTIIGAAVGYVLARIGKDEAE